MTQTTRRTSRLAMFSLLAAALTLLSFCGGVAPIPLTGWFCFPAAIVLGALALVTGIAALGGLRHSGEAGRGMALAGAWIGGLTVLATLCAIVLTVSAIAVLIHQWWLQLHP